MAACSGSFIRDTCKLLIFTSIIICVLFHKADSFEYTDIGPCKELRDPLSECTCTKNTLGEIIVVECIDKKFEDFTILRNSLPTTIQNLTFVGNNLGDLGDNIFGDTSRKYENLLKINMSRNGIRSINGKCFHKVYTVQILDLSDNEWLPHNDNRVFSNFESLHELYLRDAFYPVYNMTGLQLTSLKKIFNASQLVNLQHLDMSHNNLINIDQDFVCHLPSLRKLDLNMNDLLDVNFFHNCSQRLEEIYVRTNAISTFPRESLMEFAQMPKLRKVDVTDNPWKCDCYLEDFLSFLHGNKSQIFDDAQRTEMVCHSPLKRLENKKLVDLDVKELESCRYDDMQNSLRTSYIIIGLLFAAIGVLLIVVLYLNRAKVKARFSTMSGPIRDMIFGPGNRGYSTVNI